MTHLRTRAFILGLALIYIVAAPLLGLFDTLQRDEATVAGGTPLGAQSWCLSRSLGLVCTTSFKLKIAQRVFTHTDVFFGRSADSLSVMVEKGAPIRVRYNRKACRGVFCTILAAEHQDRTLVSFSPIGSQDAFMVWLLMIGGGLCLWTVFRPAR